MKSAILITLLVSFSFIFSCSEDENPGVSSTVTLSTTSISEITGTSAKGGGDIQISNEMITARGVCWSLTNSPTVADSKTTDGNGLGVYSSSITGLASNTTYFVRAYATTASGTSYGNEVTFSTISGPVLTTKSITKITHSSATGGGDIVSDGDEPILGRGICWKNTSEPTIDDESTDEGTDLGSFESSMENLQSNTKYFVRAYVTNSLGTTYGEEVSFTTSNSPQVGDQYQGGVVGYILKEGDSGFNANVVHGIIVASLDQNTGSAIWGCANTNAEGADGTAIGTGAQNTIDIINSCGGSNVAATICAELVLEGYDDWYLPSKDELLALFENHEIIISSGAGFETGLGPDYWSSSEGQSAAFAWQHNFDSFFGGQTQSEKSNGNHVRAIRSF